MPPLPGATPSETAVALIGFTGPLLLAGFFHWGLFGSFILQHYHYRNSVHAKSDSALVKFFVYTNLAVQVISLVFVSYTIWFILIQKWGVPDVATQTGWPSPLPAIMSSASASIVQFFFAWRIVTLWKTTVTVSIAIGAIMMSLLQFAACTAFVVKYYMSNDDFSQIAQIAPIVELWLSSEVIGDWVLGITMVLTLQRMKKTSPFPGTQKVLDKLIINIIESGLITATAALAYLILYRIIPQISAHVTLEFILGSLYANVLMANLNGRDRLKARGTNQTTTFSTIRDSLPPLAFATSDQGDFSVQNVQNPRAVFISTDVVRHSDHQFAHASIANFKSGDC
ncbi:hypothetical protein GYMLUDRAFT_47904 [Collybiopsis luxurians FD-317 M1]|uniref:DUF6534 domain-containing protein n=1 Tax=Collybiopsis luxurians FD-317 M1 TaxID=944289 RepID=A0A0D0CBC5_9AGAR|nr:hypothetical protein GYMLUDRAFT_47904 [Collybiopsis luxurians FD-317 M1]